MPHDSHDVGLTCATLVQAAPFRRSGTQNLQASKTAGVLCAWGAMEPCGPVHGRCRFGGANWADLACTMSCAVRPQTTGSDPLLVHHRAAGLFGANNQVRNIFGSD